jgi:hypothetical protein
MERQILFEWRLPAIAASIAALNKSARRGPIVRRAAAAAAIQGAALGGSGDPR